MLRKIRWVAIGLILALAVVWIGKWTLNGGPAGSGSTGIGVSVPGGVQVGGPFKLIDSNGKTVTDADYRGRWTLVYFGYTFCPDVCPTELQAIAGAMHELGPIADQITPIFITIDPERDTPQAIGEYVKLFDERLVGLTGSPADIAAVARAYRVYYAKAETKTAGAYLMDHSSFLYLMGPDGRLRMLIKPGTTSAEIAADIRSQMNAS